MKELFEPLFTQIFECEDGSNALGAYKANPIGFLWTLK
jgi:hypothetical protein